MRVTLGVVVVMAFAVRLFLVPRLSMGDPPLSATVEFGQPKVGSPFPPPSGHDQSSNAKNNLVPRTVVISQDGTVTFDLFGVHQVATYGPRTEPEDIEATIVAPPLPGCPPVPLINDPLHRVALLGAQPCAGGPTTHVTVARLSPLVQEPERVSNQRPKAPG
jgi:hypothetical protein